MTIPRVPPFYCVRCATLLTDQNWYPSRKFRRAFICKLCTNSANAPSTRRRRALKKVLIREQERVRSRRVVQAARDLLGGACQLCGAANNLHFAHLYYLPGERQQGSRNNADRVLRTPERFLLLCADCHYHPEKYLKEVIDRRLAEAKAAEDGCASA